MINTEIFEGELEGLYNNYYDCVGRIVQKKILLQYPCEDELGAVEKELAQIKRDYHNFVEIMGEYVSLDELGEALFEVEKKLMNERYGTNDGVVVAELSIASDCLKDRLTKAHDIIERYD